MRMRRPALLKAESWLTNILDYGGSLIGRAAVVAGLTAVAISLFISIFGDEQTRQKWVGPTRGEREQAVVDGSVRRSVEPQLAAMKSEIKKLTARLDAMKMPTQDQQLSQQLVLIQVQLTSLRDRQRAIDDVLLTSPEKALAVPLLRRDLENERTQNAAALLETRAAIDRIWDLAKWLIGGAALSIIGWVLIDLLRGRQASKSSELKSGYGGVASK